MIHDSAYEGSCRVGKLENLTYEAELHDLKQKFQQITDKISSVNLPGVEFLDPVTMYRYVNAGNPNIETPQEQFELLDKDNHQTDLYVVTFAGLGEQIAEKYKKPVVILSQGDMLGTINKGGWAAKVPAVIRQLGIPGFYVQNWDQLINIIKLFKVQKSVKNTKLLVVTDLSSKRRLGDITTSPADHLSNLKDIYNLDYQLVNNEEFFNKMDEIINDDSYKRNALELTQNLMENAENNNMTKEDIISSVEFYQTAKAMMKQYGCNAFTIDCFELCSTLQPCKRRFTPCLAHALLKDNGIPSACEGDLNCFMAMMLEMYISRKAVYMGNQDIFIDDNILQIHHSVASLNMKGIDNKKTPYDIHSFTNDGFGVTLRHDFSKDINEQVTVARFDPSGIKILVSSGPIVGGGGMKGLACVNHVKIRIPDGESFFDETQNFGNHLAVVFGDYVNEIKKLGRIMNFEMVVV